MVECLRKLGICINVKILKYPLREQFNGRMSETSTELSEPRPVLILFVFLVVVFCITRNFL